MEGDWGRGPAPRWDSQARPPVSPHQRVGVTLGGGASRGREAWLGCQVPSPFVQLLSCCLGQSPEQPPPEPAERSSLPARLPARPDPRPARPGSTRRCGRDDRGRYRGARKGGEWRRGRVLRLRAGEGGSQGASPCTGGRGRAGARGAATLGDARLGPSALAGSESPGSKKGGKRSGRCLPGTREPARRRVPDSRLPLAGRTLTRASSVPGSRGLGIHCLGNLLPLVSSGHPHPTSRVIPAPPPCRLPQAWVGPYCLRPAGPAAGAERAFSPHRGPHLPSR